MNHWLRQLLLNNNNINNDQSTSNRDSDTRSRASQTTATRHLQWNPPTVEDFTAWLAEFDGVSPAVQTAVSTPSTSSSPPPSASSTALASSSSSTFQTGTGEAELDLAQGRESTTHRNSASYGTTANRKKYKEEDSTMVDLRTPYYPNMALFRQRLETFKKWSPSNIHRPETLASAGFFYKNNISDQVTCFMCAGGIEQLLPTDNIFGEHQRHFPSCPFIKLNGHQSSQGRKPLSTMEPQIHHVEPQHKNTCETLVETEDKLSCKVCFDQTVSVVCIPCGHLLCSQCIFAVKRCPICRKRTKRAMKIFLN